MPDVTSSEPIVAVLSGLQQHKGFLGLKVQTYNLVITPTRLVFAAISSKLMNEAVAQARAEAKSQGAGFFGQWGAQFGWMGVLERRLLATPVDAIFDKFPGSFSLPAAEVRRITLRTEEDEESARETHEVRIEAASGKYRFQLAGKTAAEARAILSQALPGVVR